jgi:glycosyltransferase involved in cell wall biosynthesis
MEQTLGHLTHYLNLRRHEALVTSCKPHWLPVDYRDGLVPWMVTGSLAARRALKPLLTKVDAIFMHTITMAPLAADYFGHCPAVLSADGTPLNKRAMRQAYGMKSEAYGAGHAKRLLYREVFARARGFVAWSSWVKQSFVDDYGCREQDVAVISPGIDVEQFTDAERSNELPRILFVGADFVRKGGDQLLRVFRERLRHKAELVLVTHAPVAEEPGVTVHRTIAPNSRALIELYRSADIFALPTRADCYSMACMEALASGLPIVATRVGGIPDIVRDGETGHLLDVDDAEALGDTLEAMIADPAGRREMGRHSRQDAVNRFDSRESARKLFAFMCARC